jgi:cell division septation protein DedD
LQDAQAWALYRVGLSQQRIGLFPEADTTFARVQQQFPNTEPARRAGGHLGARAFQVQVGTFADADNAQTLMTALSAEGYASTRSPDSQGRQVVRVGPFPTYDLAKAVRKALAAKYPGATIVP